MPGLHSLLVALLAFPVAAQAAARVQAAPVPPEMRSTAFSVKVNSQEIGVAHAAASYEFVSFDGSGPFNVEITAAELGFWDKGVDIQPWRLGLRPVREGQKIRFRLNGPAKLSISRPGDFLNHAAMLFLFAGTPPPPAPGGPNVQIVPAGIHRESLNPKSGETIYLAPGAYVFGSLNLWKVHDVKILGRGTIIYDGPQDPNSDEGWMQKPDWHCIGALEARDVEIDGLTCIVRSRTWSIQMKDTANFAYNDLRVIGGNPGNANQDGMDWLGGGDATVRDAFIRASDDDLALMGNWDGYTDADMLRPGHDVQNILVENSELSTSISNIVRAGWPRKTFNSRNFTLRDSDILHGGIGACGQTFGLIGFWGAQGAKGEHSNYTFENLTLDNWYSLAQMEQEFPGLQGFGFRNIWALDQPPLADSTITGDVAGVTFENVKYGQNRATGDADLPLVVTGGAAAAKFAPSEGPVAAFTVEPPVFAPGDKVTFTAQISPKARYTWLFGDGTEATGRRVRHRFPDALGTELDGSGRFRVLLHVEDNLEQNQSKRALDESLKGGFFLRKKPLEGSAIGYTYSDFALGAQSAARQDWAAQGVVVVGKWHEAVAVAGPTVPGLAWQIYPGTWTELPELATAHAIFSGEGPNLRADAQGFTSYVAAWDGFIEIPADGGYSFHLLDRDGARLLIDGVEVARTGPPFAQVCGSPGNAMRYDRGSLGLRAGKHTFRLEGLHSVSQGSPRLLWEGPSLPLTDVPPAAYSHARQDALKQGTGNKD